MSSDNLCLTSLLTSAPKLGLNIPIRQGQTRYQYLVMQFSREEEITAELNMSECVSLGFPLFLI
jgi:hypothetical protein